MSLLIHEGRSVVEVAAQAGHAPTMTPGTYAHVIAELEGAVRVPAGTQILAARGEHVPVSYLAEPPEPKPDHEIPAPKRALCRTRTGDPFLTMAVESTRAPPRAEPKCLQASRSDIPHPAAPIRIIRHPPVPRRYLSETLRGTRSKLAIGSLIPFPTVPSRMSKSQSFSIRLGEHADPLVRDEVRRSGRSRSVVVEELAEEAAKMRVFRGVAFRRDTRGARG